MTNWSLTILLLHLWSLLIIAICFFDFKQNVILKKLFEKKSLSNGNEIIVQHHLHQQQQQEVPLNPLNEIPARNNEDNVEIMIIKSNKNPSIIVC